MEKLEATVRSTRFRNPENGYTVLTVHTDRQDITVVGALPQLAQGEKVTFTGDWKDHKIYGHQFQCVHYEIHVPTTREEIERQLVNYHIRGIKEPTAAQIVARFGEETLTVLSEHPERLMEIPGIGRKKCIMISESFQEKLKDRTLMSFLQSYGISGTIAQKIIDFYQEEAPEVIRSNPYRLCVDLERVGFKTADRIALNLGFAQDAEQRIRGALSYVLQEAASSSGHVYLPETVLCERATFLLQVPLDLCRQQLTALLLERRLIAEPGGPAEPGERGEHGEHGEHGEKDRRIYLPFYHRAEKDVALRLTHLMLSAIPDRFARVSREIASFEKEHQVCFSPTQRQAIRQALENGVFVITGGPGTGKTTIINCVLALLSRRNKVELCAPTGRAAKRMTEATGVEAKTIHRLLEFNPKKGFSRCEENPLDADCFIVDESSMIDLLLMRSLLRAIEPGSCLILVGDADQLPSVGAGNVLGDILKSGCVPNIRLTDIFRQSDTSRIVLNAHLINQGKMPLLNEKGTDFFFERQATLTGAADAVIALASSRLPAYLKYPKDQAGFLSMRNLQVLSPTRKGDCGVAALNLRLQAALNPPDPDKPEFVHGDIIFRLGDKVIQTHNDYELSWVRDTDRGEQEGEGVFNGDIGFITEVHPEDASLTVRFDDERDVRYGPVELENLDLAYCLSVHKSQGSEFPTVILPVVSAPPLLMTRNLLYTALTRARSLVVLVGQEEIIRRMVENNHVLRRYTALTQRLLEVKELVP